MSCLARFASLSALAAGGALVALCVPGGVVTASAAASSTQQACSQQYQAAKAANTLNGQNWSQFYSGCAAQMKANGGAAAAPAPKAAAKTVAAAPKPAPAALPAIKASAGGQTTQQICSGQYQAAKAAGSLNGQTWPQFLSACSASIKSYDGGAVPAPEPMQAPATTAAAKTRAVSTGAAAIAATDKNGKPLSPGEIAFRQRIHACSQEWQADKQAGSLPSGQTWPQFWSACNSQLKAQG